MNSMNKLHEPMCKLLFNSERISGFVFFKSSINPEIHSVALDEEANIGDIKIVYFNKLVQA